MGDHERTEIDRLDPEDATFTLSTGLEIRIVPLKTRQLFRFMRILTHGAGAALLANGLDFGGDAGEFASRLSAIAMLAIPDADQETMEFLGSMCEPSGLVTAAKGKALSDKDKAANDALWERLNTDMFNPDPMDTVDIIEMIVIAEAADLQALGKKLARMLEKIRPRDLKPPAETLLASPQELSEASSSAPSPPPSTPSAPSTDGPTSTSSTSPSPGSVPLEPPSVPAGHPGALSGAL